MKKSEMISDLTHEVKVLKKERLAMDVLLREIEDVSCGREQVAEDDSGALSWIYNRIQMAWEADS